MTKIYYDKKYFEWQRYFGIQSGFIDIWKFSSFIKKGDTVLDFGCGGGYILENLSCKEKYGVEINKSAQADAKKRGIKVYEKIEKIPKNIKFDVVLSHHTLEHLENPFEILKRINKSLKKGGATIHIVPVDDWRFQKKYFKENVNKHLYTWTPLLLGNLFEKCGFTIRKVEIYPYQWPHLSRYYFKFMPRKLYYFLCQVWGYFLNIYEIKIVASS